MASQRVRQRICERKMIAGTQPLQDSWLVQLVVFDVRYVNVAVLIVFTDRFPVRSFPMTLGLGAGLAVIQGVFDYTGGKFSGYDKDPNVNEYERKEELRRNKRRPIQETLLELGEGRGETYQNLFLGDLKGANFIVFVGIYAPGHRERRADRIKENYGIDVPRT